MKKAEIEQRLAVRKLKGEIVKRSINSYKDIIEFAIGHEMKSYHLYMDLSKKMVYPKTRNLCKRLAKEERTHITRLEKESARKCQLVTPVNLSRYNIAGSNVNIFANRMSMLLFAIKKEKASVKLYRDFAELTRNEPARQLFMWLVEEELKHQRKVELEYNSCLK